MARNEAGARARILQTAGDLFADRGFDAVSVADIAAGCGVSTGLIYYHFKDKQTLFESVVREGVHLFEEVAVRTLTAEGSPRQRLETFMAEYMALLAGRPALMRLLIRSVLDLGGPAPQHVVMRGAITIDRVQTVIAEGVAAGEFRPVNEPLAAMALFGLVNTLVTAHFLETPIGRDAGSPTEQATFMTDLFLNGIAPCP